MALTNSWPGVNGAATTTDARKALAGLIETDAAGAVRSGVFPSSTSAIVTARADMNVDIAVFQGVANQFGGPILIANDGVAQLPSVLVSPGAGTNYYVVYAKQNESTAPGTDASNTKVFGAQLSTTSFAAARAALPTGALELATVQMPTGKTATNNAGVTITQTFQYTATEGGVVLLRNSTEESAWSPHDGSLAYRLDLARTRDRVGGVWVSRGAACHLRMSADPATHGTPGTFQAVAWTVEDLDTDGFHDNTTNNTRMTAPAPGTYIATGKLRYGSTTNAGGVALGKNGTADYETESFATPNTYSGSYAQTVKVYQLAAGDYIEVFSKGQASSLVISADRSYGELVRIG